MIRRFEVSIDQPDEVPGWPSAEEVQEALSCGQIVPLAWCVKVREIDGREWVSNAGAVEIASSEAR